MSTGGPMRSQVFRAGRVLVAVDTDDTRIRAAVDDLFVDLRATDVAVEPEVVVEVIGAPQGWDVGPAGGPYLSYVGPAAALRELVRLVNRAALDHDPERLHLHASAVTVADRLLVLSAPSGTGKSTTAAALLFAGATYLTDETIALEAAATEVHGFPKPLTARRGAVAMLPELEAGAVRIDPRSAPPLSIPVSALGVPWRPSAAPFAVAVLRRAEASDETSEPVIEPMSRADACVALVQESLDFDRFGDRALETIARLCAASHCFEVRLGEPRATAAALTALVAGLPSPPTLESSGGDWPDRAVSVPTRPSRAQWVPAAGVRWAHLGDEVVVHHGRTGAVVSLRPAGADWWRAIAAGTEPGEDEGNDPLTAFLAAEGFVTFGAG